MGILKKLEFYAWSASDTVEKVIEEWIPEDCKSEKDYERSLFDYLHESLPDFDIKKQYAIGRSKVDLMIENRVMIELKHNLNTTAKFQRLMGQIQEYMEWRQDLIIVLTGECDRDFVQSLRIKLTGEGSIISNVGFKQHKVIVKKN